MTATSTNQEYIRQKLKTLASLPFAFLGYSCIRAWVSLMFANPVFVSSVTPPHIQFVFDFCLACTCLVCAACARKIGLVSSRNVLYFIAGALLVVGTALHLFALSTANTDLFFVSTPLCGIGFAVGVLIWCELFCFLSPTKVAVCLALCTAGGVVLSFLLEGNKDAYLAGWLIALPAISLLLARRAFWTQDKSDIPSSPQRIIFPWKIILVLCLYEVVMGLFLGSVSREDLVFVGSHSTVATLAASLVLFVVVFFLSDKFDTGKIYRSPMLLMVCGLVLIPFFGFDAGIVGVFVMSISSTLFGLIVMLFLCDISRQLNVSAVFLFGIEEITFILKDCSIALGEWVRGQALFGDMSNSVLSAIGVVLVVVFTLLLITDKEIRNHWGIGLFMAVRKDGSEAGGAMAESERVNLACEELAAKRNLSPRELEVLKLLAQGKSLSKVSQELFIAEGTAKAHTKHIYTKVGVGSRQELFDVLAINPKTRAL